MPTLVREAINGTFIVFNPTDECIIPVCKVNTVAEGTEPKPGMNFSITFLEMEDSTLVRASNVMVMGTDPRKSTFGS